MRRTGDLPPERLELGEHSPELASLALGPTTPVALDDAGPFVPLAVAIETNGKLRDALARDIAIPSLARSVHARTRFAVLAATALPMAMLIELDREAVMRGHASPARLIVDLLLVAYVVFELTRQTPRMPGVCALSLVAIALRWALVPARLCGHSVEPLVYAGAALPLAAALVVLVRVPSRSRVVLELLGKLGIARTELFAATASKEPSGALVAAAVACAAGLPAVLHVARLLGAGLVVQGIVFAGFAIAAPELVRRTLDARSRPSPRPSLIAIATGLALTAAAVTAARLFFDFGAEIARCASRLDAEAKSARAAEAVELARAIAKVRASTVLVIMTTLVFPLAEERIYRGLLQDVLARKYGRAYAVAAAALAFGVAHIGIYHVALYQTVLLGIGFGVAFAEGGLIAAFVVHATWNLLQLG